MTTAALLQKNQIKKALIVDDGYDVAPRLEDLDSTNEDWSTFFDDLTAKDHELLRGAYDKYDPASDVDYSKDEVFLQVVWKLREQLAADAVAHILATYETSQRTVLTVLDKAEASLKSFGLQVSKAGRDFVDAASDADLILIDLYLGTQHVTEDMQLSVAGLRECLNSRMKSPPAIILMSSHPQLANKRAKFRDDACVFASGFRAIRKSEITKDGRMDQLLFELARHREDSLKLSVFLETWREGIVRSIEATSTDIRRLDLEDLAQIHDLLLDEEKELRGSYMLDLVDRLLLHEVESHRPTISAAKTLNAMDSEDHPPNTMMDSKDNLALVKKTLYMHENRRSLDSPTGYPVRFGDIIALKSGAKAPAGSIFSGAKNSVFAVMTPLCDLVRDPPKAKKVLLLEGECRSVDAVAYLPPSPNDRNPRTIVLQHGSKKVGVEWKPKKLETLSQTRLENLLSKEDVFIAGRLRNEFALDLQQTMLSGVGRVGLMAPMPSNYQIEARLLYPNLNRDFVALKTVLSGVCVVGRSRDKKTARIGFDSSQRLDFTDEIRSIVDNVRGECRSKVRDCYAVDCVNALFAEGFVCDLDRASSKTFACKLKVGGHDRHIGTVIYEAQTEERIADPGQRQQAGLVFEITVKAAS